MFFDPKTNGFRISWLSASGWSGDSDGNRSVLPGQGLLLHSRSGSVTLTTCGSVRGNLFAQALTAGTQLIGAGFPVANSPRTLGLTTAAGFVSSARVSQADRLRLWEADTTPGLTSYQSYFFHTRSSGSAWVQENDASLRDRSTETLVQPGQAFFILPRTAKPEFKEPQP